MEVKHIYTGSSLSEMAKAFREDEERELAIKRAEEEKRAKDKELMDSLIKQQAITENSVIPPPLNSGAKNGLLKRFFGAKEG